MQADWLFIASISQTTKEERSRLFFMDILWSMGLKLACIHTNTIWQDFEIHIKKMFEIFFAQKQYNSFYVGSCP